MIDFSAREQHFADHLTPIWWALPADMRGRFHVAAGIAVPDVAVTAGWPDPQQPGPVVCASWGDLQHVRRLGRPVVLSEHGAGQSYAGVRHPSYAGGRHRETVDLFLVPNEQAAARNRRWYPAATITVVGSPRVDDLRRVGRHPGGPTAAVSFHWRCGVVRESGTAFDHYAAHLAATRTELAAAGITLIGHGHPRILTKIRGIYDAAGIETVTGFRDVVARTDVLAVDNSSVMFEFAALNRPVVVLNSPHWRRNVHHGLRFWDAAPVGLNVDQAEHLARTIIEAFTDPARIAERRRNIIDGVYPTATGGAARVAADAIATLAAHTPKVAA